MKKVYLSGGFVIDNIDHARLINKEKTLVGIIVPDDTVCSDSTLFITEGDIELDVLNETFKLYVNIELHSDVLNHEETRGFEVFGKFSKGHYSTYPKYYRYNLNLKSLSLEGVEYKKLSAELQSKIEDCISEAINEMPVECVENEYTPEDNDF